jgi:hypothetical protein
VVESIEIFEFRYNALGNYGIGVGKPEADSTKIMKTIQAQQIVSIIQMTAATIASVKADNPRNIPFAVSPELLIFCLSPYKLKIRRPILFASR